MLLAFVASLLHGPKTFVWRPAVCLDDPAIVSTLMADLSR